MSERVPLTERLLARSYEQVGREVEECRPLVREVARAAWVDGYETLLHEVANIVGVIPPDGKWGRPTHQVRYLLGLLRDSLPAWEAVRDEVRDYQRQHGRRECDLQFREMRRVLALQDEEETP